MKKFVASFCLLLLALAAEAQLKSIKIGVNGLTCSQCSRTVELEIRKLPFVADVKMSLEQTVGEIFVKADAAPDYKKIAQAVVNAGFSVRFLEENYQFSHQAIKADECVNLAGQKYIFLNTAAQSLDGTVHLQFIGAPYQQKKELKKWLPKMKNTCDPAADPYYVIIKS